MSRGELLALAALGVSVIGMMFVVAGVISTGFFLPGAVLIGIGMIGFAASAVLAALSSRPGTRVERR
jgi:hypothetical protein